MYKVLYRAYRPEVFDDVLGQEHIVKILRNQIAQGNTAHAYLFCGTRGTGKTTIARLLAKAMNCTGEGEHPCGVCDSCNRIKDGNFMDLIEIDAASNRGIDNIRELRESVNYPPAVGRTKVYIIDEVHMLSREAFNALLKTLEEPPESVMFILCTTEPEQLPATILSRCMRMDFRRVSEVALAERVQHIAKEQGTSIDDAAVRIIVAAADGSARDCLTLLDRCISGHSGAVSRDDVLEAIGTVGEDVFVDLTQRVTDHDAAGGLELIDALIKTGKDSRQILQGWMNHYRNLLMAKFVSRPEEILSMSVENIERILRQAETTPVEMIDKAIIEIAKTVSEAKLSNQPRVLLEICFVKLATTSEDGRVINVTSRTVPRQMEPKEESRQATQQGSVVQNEPAAQKAVPQQATNTSTGEVDADELADIWRDILEDGESQTDTFTIVRTGATPVKMNDSQIVINVSGLAEKYLEKNRIPMEELIQKYVGSHREMILRREDMAQAQPDMQETAARLEDMLGTKVEIK